MAAAVLVLVAAAAAVAVLASAVLASALLASALLASALLALWRCGGRWARRAWIASLTSAVRARCVSSSVARQHQNPSGLISRLRRWRSSQAGAQRWSWAGRRRWHGVSNSSTQQNGAGAVSLCSGGTGPRPSVAQRQWQRGKHRRARARPPRLQRTKPPARRQCCPASRRQGGQNPRSRARPPSALWRRGKRGRRGRRGRQHGANAAVEAVGAVRAHREYRAGTAVLGCHQ